jgi:phytoene dehydrogenase-like protein
MKRIKLFDISARKARDEIQAKRKLLANRLDWAGTTDAQRETIKADLAEIDANPASTLRSAEADAIWDALEAVNGKARTHCYTTAGELVRIADAIERKLERHGVALKIRPGVTVVAISGVPTSKSYARKGSRSAIATRVVLERGASAWYVTNIERQERYTGPGGDEKIKVTMTDAVREAVIRNALSDFE